MAGRTRKSPNPKPVALTAQEEADQWRRIDFRRLARESTDGRKAIAPPLVDAGDYPTSTMTREEFWRRDDPI